jgi:hypothetical protein
MNRHQRRAAAATSTGGRRKFNVRLDGTPYRFRLRLGVIDPPPPPRPLRLDTLRAEFYPVEVHSLLAKASPGNPLWRQFAAMTPKQVKDEQTAEFDLLIAEGMDLAELEERLTEWEIAAAIRNPGGPFVDHIDRQLDLERYLLTPDGYIVDTDADDGEGAVLDEADPECIRLRKAFSL